MRQTLKDYLFLAVAIAAVIGVFIWAIGYTKRQVVWSSSAACCAEGQCWAPRGDDGFCHVEDASAPIHERVLTSGVLAPKCPDNQEIVISVRGHAPWCVSAKDLREPRS